MSTDEDLTKHYSLEQWLADFDFWVSAGPLRSVNVPQVLAYFRDKYPDNAQQSAMASQFWNSLQFLEALLPELIEQKVLSQDSDGGVSFPTGFQSAFYRATFSFPEVAWRHRINAALLGELTKQQKDWNEDRS